jgi:hypothetical protein
MASISKLPGISRTAYADRFLASKRSHRGIAACGVAVGLPDHGPFGSRDWLLTARVRFDGLDVVHAAAIPLRADSTAIRCGEIVEQVGHRGKSLSFAPVFLGFSLHCRRIGIHLEPNGRAAGTIGRVLPL